MADTRLLFWLLGSAALAALYSTPAAARDDMSGTWKENYSETIFSVEQWSKTCGEMPRSTGRRKRGLVFDVEDRGFDLRFSRGGKGFTTVDCFTSNKGVKPKERTVKDKLFMISCSTPEDTDDYENGLYSFRIKSPKRIEYKETTRFSRNVSGSMCVHTKRVRRLYTKVKDAVARTPGGDSTPAPKPDPKPDPAPEPQPPVEPEDPCAKPGSPASVSFEPSRAEVRQGSKVCIEVAATDSNGCEVDAKLSWGPGPQPQDIELTPQGCLQVGAGASLGSRTVILQAGGVETELELVVERRVVVAKQPSRPPVQEPTEEPQRQEEPPTAEEPDAGAPEADGADGDLGEDAAASGATETTSSPDSGTPPEERSPGIVQPEPEEKPQGPTKEAAGNGLPGWVLPVAIGGGSLLLLLVLVVLVRSRKKGALVTPQSAPDEDQLEASWGLDLPDGSETQDEVPEEGGDTKEPTDGDAESGSLCSKCDQPMAPGTEFCTECGSWVAASSFAGQAVATPAPVEATLPEDEEQSDDSDSTFCTECGTKIPAVAKFCPFCRAKQG